MLELRSIDHHVKDLEKFRGSSYTYLASGEHCSANIR